MNPLNCALVLTAGLLCFADVTAASELEERTRIVETVRTAFLFDDFRRLDRMSEEYRTERSRTPSGIWKLSAYYAGIRSAIGGPTRAVTGSFEAMEDKTAVWAQRNPDSSVAYIAHSLVLVNHAWAFRGGTLASEVKPEDWAPFYQYIGMAREVLEKNKAVASRDPRWYETMLLVAKAENWEWSRFESLLNEALDREPLFYPIYFSALSYLLPKWHGDIVQIEQFARAAVMRTASEDGRSMYARIYWHASQIQFHNDLFTDSLANWPRMRDGFEDLLAKYPDQWNINNYAKFACLARDKLKTRELLTRIDPLVMNDAWQPAGLFQECTDWSRELGPGEFES